MSQFLFCPKCTPEGGSLADCTCPDRDEGLRTIAYDPNGRVAFKWCRKCDKHYARCKCENPEFFVIHQGQEWKVPAGGFPNAAGGRTMPNFEAR